MEWSELLLGFYIVWSPFQTHSVLICTFSGHFLNLFLFWVSFGLLYGAFNPRCTHSRIIALDIF